MSKRPLRPSHPERICWGCDKYCPADDLGCANGTIRTPHPCELFGDDWLEWSLDATPSGGAGTTSGETGAAALPLVTISR
jgi:hypothetical protein